MSCQWNANVQSTSPTLLIVFSVSPTSNRGMVVRGAFLLGDVFLGAPVRGRLSYLRMKHRCGQRNHHRDILAMCCKVISSFVIFVVLDLRVADVVLQGVANCVVFLPRFMECKSGLVILFVCLRLTVRPSVKCVDCDKTEERSVQIFILEEISFSQVL